MPGETRKPVVRVEGINLVSVREPTADTGREVSDDLVVLFLGQLRRASIDVHDPKTGFDLDLVR